MMEEGSTLTETAEACGVAIQVVSDWAESGGWKRPEVIRQVRIQEQRLKVDPMLTAAIQRLETMPRSQREADYDEKMHRIACSVPLILSQMSADELVTKADKVAKLVQLSREVLGRGVKASRPPTISLNLLSNNPLPPRREETLQVIDAEALTD
jgi:hypothetical protein